MAGSRYPGDQDPGDPGDRQARRDPGGVPREPGDFRERRDPRDVPREPGDFRERRDPRDVPREPRDPGGFRDPEEQRDARHPRQSRQPRDPEGRWIEPEPANRRWIEPRAAAGRWAEAEPPERRPAESAPGRQGAADRYQRREGHQSEHGGERRTGGRAAWWTPRTQAALAVAIVVTVIAVGGFLLRASRADGPSQPGGQVGGPAAGTGSPAAGPSGHAGAGAASSSPGAGPGTVSIDWVGDMTFGTLNAWPPAGVGSLLNAVTPSLHSDLTIGNLETVLGDLSMTKCAPHETDCYEFEAPGSTAQDLKEDGFSAVNVANNHTLDAGTAGEASTDAALRAAGLAWAGRPGQITYLTRNGITIALLGFAPWSYDADALDLPAAEALVRQARQHAQVVIVMEHVGAEGDDAQHVRPGEEYYLGQDRGNPIAFTHGVIDAGADLVVGSGPHVLRGFQWYHGHLIAYSVGNFCGYNTLGLDSVTSVSAVLHVTLGAQGQFVSGGITPLRLTPPGAPRPDPAGAAISTVNDLSQADFSGNGAVHIAAAGTIQPSAT